MGKIKRKVDVQIPLQICRAIESGTPVAEICRDYQLQRTLVDTWRRKFSNGNLEAGSASKVKLLEKQNEKLKAKIGELTMEIDLLKKVDEWKRSQRSVDTSIITSRNLAQFQRPAGRSDSQYRATITSQKKKR